MLFKKVLQDGIITKEVTINNSKYIIIKKIYDLNNNLVSTKEILSTNSRKMIDKAIENILKRGYIEL